MFPLIPAILFLLLQGSVGLNPGQPEGRLAQAWALHRDVSTGDVRPQAALAQFLTLVSLTEAAEAAKPRPAPAEPDPATPPIQVAVSPAPQPGFQSAGRTRDGPLSIG